MFKLGWSCYIIIPLLDKKKYKKQTTFLGNLTI